MVNATIFCDGKKLPPEVPLLSINIRQQVNRIPTAEVTLVDGDPAKRKFQLSNSGQLEPGQPLEIKLRWDDGHRHRSTRVFQGKIVRHGVESSGEGPALVIGAKDSAIKLTGERKNAVYRKKSDRQIISDILDRAGLRKGKLAATRPRHPEIVQFNCTDWDFILSRADIQGLLVTVESGKVSLEKIAAPGAAKHQFEWGMDTLYDFEMAAEGGHQFKTVTSVGWNQRRLRPTSPKRGHGAKNPQGNLDGDTIAGALGFSHMALSAAVPLEPEELTAWANARVARGDLSLVRGRLGVRGRSDIELLDWIELEGISQRFNGKALVTGIEQRIDARGWRTDLILGLSPEDFCHQPNILEAPAAGLLPAIQGLQIGMVAAFAQDPDKEYRVKVLLPAFGETHGSVWARLASPEAGKGRGYFFRPEPGDEVIVGFLNDDPRFPVILGSLYGAKNTPPSEFARLSAKNAHKGIVTKKKTTFALIDDDKAKVIFETAHKNKILIDDGAEKIEISDQHGNHITMSKNGIRIQSARDLEIAARGKVEIKGMRVDVK